MSGSVWMFSDQIDDEDMDFMRHEFVTYSMAERYAQGLVWLNDSKDDYTQELLHLKEMLLLWCQGEKTGGEV